MAPESGRATLHVIAGPNGAGKTSLYEAMISRLTDAEFVNADRLIQAKLGRHPANLEEAQLGQQLADERRAALIAGRKSFVAESTFSHPSKLDLIVAARRAGYRIVVYHVGLDTAELAVARVTFRQRNGGHPVPEEKIRGRYERNRDLIREAARMADWAYVFDNSVRGQPPRRLLTFQDGRVTDAASDPPTWVAALYRDDVEAAGVAWRASE